MRFMVQAMQPPVLTPEQQAQLQKAIGAFYANIPADVTLECDYIRADRRGSWSVLSVPDRATLDRVMAPFEGLVVVDIVPVLTAEEAMGG